MDHNPITAADWANSSAQDNRRKLDLIAPQVSLIMRLLEFNGAISKCQDCNGAGSIPPATMVACKKCMGAGFLSE